MNTSQSGKASRSLKGSARRAFGLFNMDQARHIFAEEYSAGEEPIVIEVAPRTWFIQPGMVNIGLFETDEGLLMVDAGCRGDGPALFKAVRSLSDKPLHTVVYTHGHSDHCFGLKPFLEAGERPQIIAQERIVDHFDRYQRTAGWNAFINGQLPGADGKRWAEEPSDFDWPDRLFSEAMDIVIGGERFELRHGQGESDDAAWVWAPERKVIAAGDLVTGYFPNAGNPQKVQRYAEGWADAADAMAARGAEAIITGHGEPVIGAEAVAEELRVISAALRHVVAHVLDGMNRGVLPDEIVASLKLPEELANHPRLVPLHDRPEFVARGVFRLYGGWWDGYPSTQQPVHRDRQSAEIALLAGGVDALVARAEQLADDDLPLASTIAEWAFLADRSHAGAQKIYRDLMLRRAAAETSGMAQRGFYRAAEWVHQARHANEPATE